MGEYDAYKQGLLIAPGLVPESVQRELLSRIFHRDLSDPSHRTNLHAHYDIAYPTQHREGPGLDSQGLTSFFEIAQPQETVVQPQDPTLHKPLSLSQVLNRKLRWITLGGQYDWTRKVYPEGPPPAFPSDLARFLGSFFDMTPEAAIVNLYSPGDTLSLHRDVSEECDSGLISLSIGNDAVFIVGIEKEPILNNNGVAANEAEQTFTLVLRVRSGDMIYMSGPARFAWHGVPRVFADTCPELVSSWPAPSTSAQDSTSDSYEHWRDWSTLR